MNDPKRITLDRIINLTVSVLLGIVFSICIVTFILLKRYLQGINIEIFTLETVSIFAGAAIAMSIIFRKYVLNDD